MIFTVTWLPDAEDELTALWLDSAERGDVTDVSNYIDQLLRQDPDQLGESRGDDLRVLFVTPLGVYVRVKPEDMLVEVIHVWKFA